MRIIIEDTPPSADTPRVVIGSMAATEAASSAADGGPGPDADTAAAPSADAFDGGPPPDWLVQSVEAARQASGADMVDAADAPVHAMDAGAAPGA